MLLKQRRILTIFLIFVFCVTSFPLVSSVPSFIHSSEDPEIVWNNDWQYYQRIDVSIDTAQDAAIYQPIDINIEFDDNCWAENETVNSIRVCCWDGEKWHELESQIYDLNYSDDTHISSCGLVFLIPAFADGTEQYFVYYDDEKKPPADYPDHVSVKDAYYYYEPISGIAVEGDYYEIRQNDEVIYGVGQKGQVMNRRLSQIAIRMKPGVKTFDILNTDLLTSFSFAYQHGTKDEDEIASDQQLLSKEIIADGNLMTEFLIVSQSENGYIKSSNIYKYYYNPSEAKRIDVHVKHEILEEGVVTGIENADGRFGAIISFHSKSASMKKMVFGSILPFVHVYGENNRINEYAINTNPESKNREWAISYEDDCDIGSKAWLSYDEGTSGKTHGILFSSNSNLISNASLERDGIEVKSAGKEYLDLVGAEIDYVSISFGRNAFEPFQGHDLVIDKGLIVEFDAAFLSLQNGTYEDIDRESEFFQTLVRHRHQSDDMSGEQNIHTLKVIPHFTGRLFSFPLLRNLTDLPWPVLTAELYLNDTLIDEQSLTRVFLGIPSFRFPKLAPGKYVVKMYREYSNETRKYIGIGSLQLQHDTALHIYGTWEKKIQVNLKDQHNQCIPQVRLELYQENMLVTQYYSKNYTNITLSAPFNLFQSYVVDDIRNVSLSDVFKKTNQYVLKVYYKGFKIFTTAVPWFSRPIDIQQNLYDLDIIINDINGRPPDVDLKPYLTSNQMRFPQEIHAVQIEKGRYRFENLPPTTYTLFFSYGGYTKTKTISIPAGTDSLQVLFSYTTEVSFSLLNNRGESFSDESLQLEVKQNGIIIETDIDPKDTVFLPPGIYTVSVFNEKNTRIGSKTVEIRHDSTIEIVTNKASLLFTLVTVISLVVGAELCLLFIFKKISLNTFLKLGVLAIVIASLVQPWWMLHAENDEHTAEKTSVMYLYPPKMIDQYRIEDSNYFSLATIPEMFTDFLSLLMLIIYVGIGCMIASFIPNVILGKRYAGVLSAASIIFVTAVAIAFSIGMKRICEISLGSLQGSAILEVMLPTDQSMYMSASWGLGPGFYLILFAAVISFLAGLIDLLKRKNMLQKIRFRHH
ncbi:MAG: carboxypeptidase-like regulatory domain-containing protein [Thermoplasmatota archaeon]